MGIITGTDWIASNFVPYPTVVGKDPTTAKAAGIPHTPWYGTGMVGAGAAPTGGLNGAVFTGNPAGSLPDPAPATGETTRLAGVRLIHTGNIGHIQIVDRLWGNVPVVTTTTGQAVTSPTWPARDVSASTAGAGVMLALECSSATGNVGAITNTTVTYTNSAGTGSRTATLSSFPATAPAGTFVPLSLAAGDVGVRSVQTVTLGTSYVSGQINLIAWRLVAEVPVPNANVATLLDWDQLGLPSVWDNSVLQLLYWPTGTAVGSLAGSLTYVQG